MDLWTPYRDVGWGPGLQRLSLVLLTYRVLMEVRVEGEEKDESEEKEEKQAIKAESRGCQRWGFDRKS